MRTEKRPFRAAMAVMAWVATGVLAVNAVGIGEAVAEPAVKAAAKAPKHSEELTIELPIERAAEKGKGKVVQVDPPMKDGVHHPLYLYADTLDVDGTPLVASATPTGYAPSTIKKYLGLTGTGYGITIAIVVAYDAPTIAADLTKFDATYGLPAPPSFKKISQAGSTTSLPAANANWALEASLDVEWAHAIAPQAGILLVEAKSSSL